MLAIAMTASAAGSEWRMSGDGTLYGYANTISLNDSILNPDNQIARLAQRTDTAEFRFNLSAENETLRFIARPIFLMRETRNDFGTQQQNEIYMTQWQVRMRASESWNIAAGRDVLNWGAAQFRSPASPFYFDGGRSNPIRALIGMDVLKVTWTPNMQDSVNLVRIVRSGDSNIQTDQWRNSWLAKFDRRGENWSAGAVAVKTPHTSTFYGVYAQQTLNDALMIYGELGSSVPPFALQLSADISQPFIVQMPAPRNNTILMGAAYTFENGNALNAEYLREGNGYNAEEQRAYFQRAAIQSAMALGFAPRLMGRDYLHLVLLSNQMESAGSWRLMWTHSMTDNGNMLAGYGEKALTTRFSAFALGVWSPGNARQEFSALFGRNVTLGLKVALP